MRVLTLLALVAVTTSAAAQTPGPRPYPEEALRRLRHLEGVWRMESDLVNRAGEVVRTEVIVDTLAWLVPDRILGLTSHQPGSNAASKGMWFYDTVGERFYLVSVGPAGELWTMSGTLDEWTITSLPKLRPNGREVIIRFHHHDITEDSFAATMEQSIDGGETWRVGYRQRLTRLR